MSKKTEWKGLWNNREGCYSGQIIKKSDIPAYARLIVRYNKFYEKDSNKPRFVYCFATGEAAKAITIKSDDYITLHEKINDGYFFTEEDLQRLIEEVVFAVGGNYGDHIVSDFIRGNGFDVELI